VSCDDSFSVPLCSHLCWLAVLAAMLGCSTRSCHVTGCGPSSLDWWLALMRLFFVIYDHGFNICNVRLKLHRLLFGNYLFDRLST
jgi:hypothetical protein